MKIKKTSYTNFRMYLANHLREIIATNGVVEILWRGHASCVLITQQQYQEFMKLDEIKIHASCTAKTDVEVINVPSPILTSSVQQQLPKTPQSLIYKSQPDLFQ